MKLGRRTIPDECPVVSATSPFVSRNYKLRLVTPMFGGGAKAGEIDGQRPIRASSIRGHLRWWWRLLNRSRFVTNGVLNVAAMRAREFEIWGSTDNPSPVQIRVERGQIHAQHKRLKGTVADEPFEFKRFTPEAYALFSAIEKKDPAVQSLMREGYEFGLTLHWPTHAQTLPGIGDGF